MFCTTCGSELGVEGGCSHYTALTQSANSVALNGDPFLPLRPTISRWKIVVLTLPSVALCIAVIFLNYLRAMRWAGIINAESTGYMLSGIVLGYLLGLFVMWVVGTLRVQKLHPAWRHFGIGCVAVLFSVFVLGGESARPQMSRQEINHQVGGLFKEAASGKTTGLGGDTHWWGGPTREFFQDILDMNRQYATDVASLDNSAIKNLYSPESYDGKAHMEKVVAELQEAITVDERYASLDPIMKKMEERIARTDISESDKQAFLRGMKNNAQASLAPRNRMFQAEQVWMQRTIELYQYMAAHSTEYSIREKKLYFQNAATKDEFSSRQSKAIALHKDFLDAKSAFLSSRTSNLEKLGLSASDLPQTETAKPK
jgi:hypothetical protein